MREYKKTLLEDINKSGFPAEIDISTILEKKSWMVYNGGLFFDKEELKERELDIHAVKVDHSFLAKTPSEVDLGDKCKIVSHLIIEVKKSEKPIVFFQYGKTKTNFFPNQTFKSERSKFHHLSIVSPNTIYQYNRETYDAKESHKFYGLKNHRYLLNSLHKTFYTAFTDPSKKNQIYEAVKKVSKALDYQRERYGTGKYVLHIFTPVIVVDADIWSVTFNKKGEADLKQVDHLLLNANQLVSDSDGSRWEEDQIYDIVSRKGFSEFLAILEKDNSSLYTAWSNYINKKTKK